MPVTMPAPGASPSYMPWAASGDSSRNGGAGIEQALDALAHEQLAALGVAGARLARRRRRARSRGARRSSSTRRLHGGGVLLELGGGGADAALDARRGKEFARLVGETHVTFE